MIVGVGTDICDIRRVQATWERQGERFARKVLSEAEFEVWQARSVRWTHRGLRYLERSVVHDPFSGNTVDGKAVKRFRTQLPAKEAFSKAIGLGMRMPMSWQRCEIANRPSGQPVIVLHGELKTWFEAQGWVAHVSVTDETDYAASFVVVERI